LLFNPSGKRFAAALFDCLPWSDVTAGTEMTTQSLIHVKVIAPWAIPEPVEGYRRVEGSPERELSCLLGQYTRGRQPLDANSSCGSLRSGCGRLRANYAWMSSWVAKRRRT